MSGAATGGILAARAGLKAAGKSALVGGVILAAIEGLNILVVSTVAHKLASTHHCEMMLLKIPMRPFNSFSSKPSQCFKIDSDFFLQRPCLFV